jgi:hypothetical protein
MVVRNHHVHAGLRSEFRFPIRRRAVVNGDDQLHSLGYEFAYVFGANAVTVDQAVRDPILDRIVEEAKKIVEETRGRDAVDVIIPEDRDGLAAQNRLLNAIDRLLHTGELERISQVREARTQEALGAVRIADAALSEKSAKKRGAGQLLCQADGVPQFRV